jgi:hypothetical protein
MLRGGNPVIRLQNFTKFTTPEDSFVDRMLLWHWR